jgi:hypothetical protein
LDRFWRYSVGFLNRLVTVDRNIWARDQRRIQGIQVIPRIRRSWRHRSHQTRCWRLSSGTKMQFACRLPAEGCNLHGKALRCTSRQTVAATVSRRRGKLSKGILFLQDNAAPHKAAIKHHKLTDLHFEVLKHPAYSPELATSDYWLSLNLKNTSREEYFRVLRRPH